MDERGKNKKGMGIGEKIERFLRIGCLAIFICLFGIIILFVSRPKFFWSPLVSFLNNDVELIDKTNYTNSEAKEELNRQLESNNALTEVVLTEEILNAIAREQVPELPNLTFEFEEDTINAYWELNEKDESKLLGFIQLVKQDELDNEKVFTDLKINKIGVPKVTVPRILHKPLFNSVRKIFEFTGESTENESLIFKLLGTSSIFEIAELKVEQDQVVILLDTNNTFYD